MSVHIEYSEDNLNYDPFFYTDEGAGEVVVSPFRVAVTGLHRENLGIGQVIGCQHDTVDGVRFAMPVVAIYDPTNPGIRIEIGAHDCYWDYLGNANLELDCGLWPAGEIMSPDDYVKKLSARAASGPTPT